MKTKNPGKQRYRQFNAPAHRRGTIMSSHVDAALREKNPNMPRSVPVHKGDEVKVVRGNYRGTTGLVARVDRRRFVVEIEGVTIKKMDEKQVARGVHPSNLIIMKGRAIDSDGAPIANQRLNFIWRVSGTGSSSNRHGACRSRPRR